MAHASIATTQVYTKVTPEGLMEVYRMAHPRAHERAFVLVPWLEVDPQASLVGHGPVCRIVDQMDVSGVVRTDEKVTLP